MKGTLVVKGPQIQIEKIFAGGFGSVTLKKGGEEITLSYEELKRGLSALKALQNSLCRSIIDLLKDGGTMTVTNIYIKLRLEQSVVSQHLAMLRRAGIVNTKREGKFIYYTLNNEVLDQSSTLIKDLTS